MKTEKYLLKATALLLAAVFVLGLFSGCGKNQDAVTEPPTTGVLTTGTVEKQVVKPKLKFLRPYSTVDMNSTPEAETIREITGFEIQYDYLPQSNPLDKLNLLMAAGDMEYDYVHLQYMADNATKSVFASYAKHNQLVCLDEKLKSYPNISAINPLAWEVVKVDGKVYGIPTTSVSMLGECNMFRKDWLDAVNLEAPSTKEELLEVLRAFRDKDPGKLGEKNIPMCIPPAVIHPAISTMFGFLYNYEVDNGKLVDVRLTQKYKAYLEFMNQLYEEELLDQDYPIMNDMPKRIVSGFVGYYSGAVDPAKDFHTAMKKENNDTARYFVVSPFKSPEGILKSDSATGIQDIGFIPASSGNVESVLSYLDAFLEPENFERITIGKEGEDWQMKDDKRFPILPRFNEQKGNMWLYIAAADGETYFPLWQTRVRKTVEYYEIFDEMIAKYEPYIITNIVAFSPSMSSSVQTAKLVEDYINQEHLKFIAGARPIDEFDEFVEEVKLKGVDTVLQEYNNWYVKSSSGSN